MLHVPYRGNAPALTDLLAGQLQVLFDGISSSIEHIRSGKVRALAVTTATRVPSLPDVPTVGEFVPGYEVSVWFSVSAPRNTPPEKPVVTTAQFVVLSRRIRQAVPR
jgi:tripartite-type tricarboxylate transporter receptor subunit TctC